MKKTVIASLLFVFTVCVSSSLLLVPQVPAESLEINISEPESTSVKQPKAAGSVDTKPTVNQPPTAPPSPEHTPVPAATPAVKIMEEVIYLEEMVVTATKTKAGVMDIPQLVTTIDAEALRQSNVSFTPDLFLSEPGILIQKTNYGGGVPFIRGMTGKQILLLVDGVRMNNSLYRSGPHQYLNTIDPSQIERIEVVHGPGSLFYGSDALGGVVNIITKKRKDFSQAFDLDTTALVRFGSADQQAVGRLNVYGNAGSLGYTVGGSYKKFGNVRGGRDTGLQIPTGYQEENYNLLLNYQLNASQALVLSHQYVNQHNVPKTSEITLGGKFKFNYNPQIRSFSYLEYQAGKLMKYIDSLQVNLSYGMQQEGEEVIPDPDAKNIETRELNQADTMGAFLHLTSSFITNNKLSYGVEFYSDKISSTKKLHDWDAGTEEDIKSAFPDGATYSLLGAYLLDEHEIMKNIRIQAGVRYSRISTSGELVDPATAEKISLSLDATNICGSFGAVIGITDNINIVGTISQGFRAPNMEDFFGKVDFSTEIPNTELGPEKVLSYEGGFKIGFTNLYAEAVYYIADYTDLITRGTVMDNGVERYQRQNLSKTKIQGAEISAKYYLTEEFSVYGTGSWTLGEDEDGGPLRRIPPAFGTLGLKYLTGKYWVECYSRMAQKQARLSGGDISDSRIPEGGTPEYLTYNLRGGVNITKDSVVTLTLENLSDEDYKNHGSGVYWPGTNVILTYEQTLDIL